MLRLRKENAGQGKLGLVAKNLPRKGCRADEMKRGAEDSVTETEQTGLLGNWIQG